MSVEGEWREDVDFSKDSVICVACSTTIDNDDPHTLAYNYCTNRWHHFLSLTTPREHSFGKLEEKPCEHDLAHLGARESILQAEQDATTKDEERSVQRFHSLRRQKSILRGDSQIRPAKNR